MAIDTRVPQWMAEKGPFSNSVSNDLHFGIQVGQRNREFAAAQEFRASQIRVQEAYRNTQINTLLMRQRQIEAEQTDAAIVTDWMKDPRQPPPSGLRTPKGLQAVAQVQKAFSESEIGSKFAAVRKAYTDKIKDLDATGALRVQQLLNVNQGEITPEIAGVIDAETARVKGSAVEARALDQFGEPYVEGEGKVPTFIQSLKTGGILRMPKDWSGKVELKELVDEHGNVRGYGLPNSSGGITQLREHKVEEPTLTPAQRQMMNAEFEIVKTWWREDLDAKERRKPEMQAEMKRRLQEVQGRYTGGGPVTTKEAYDRLPAGTEFLGSDGKRYRKP